MRSLSKLLLLLTGALVLPAVAYGQGTIAGIVRDGSGAGRQHHRLDTDGR